MSTDVKCLMLRPLVPLDIGNNPQPTPHDVIKTPHIDFAEVVTEAQKAQNSPKPDEKENTAPITKAAVVKTNSDKPVPNPRRFKFSKEDAINANSDRWGRLKGNSRMIGSADNGALIPTMPRFQAGSTLAVSIKQ